MFSRWCARTLLCLLLATGCTSTADDDAAPTSTGVGPADPSGPAELAEIEAALAGGVLPNVVGWDLNELGDVTGLLYLVHDAIDSGQGTDWVGSDDAPPGTIVGQHPIAGTPLAEIDAGWVLLVSDGGPVISFDELPADVAAFTEDLRGFDEVEPIIERRLDQGIAYKTDRWLFGTDCEAVNAAYRTFLDPRYNTACPGAIDGGPLD